MRCVVVMTSQPRSMLAALLGCLAFVARAMGAMCESVLRQRRVADDELKPPAYNRPRHGRKATDPKQNSERGTGAANAAAAAAETPWTWLELLDRESAEPSAWVHI